jgi:dTDP-4-dehydrorhamnose reductase
VPTPRILLLGKNGQVGFELQRSLAPLGEVIALDRHSQPLSGDLVNLEALATTVRALRPTFIVNAAAYTAVDKAEAEPELARRVNAEAPGLLASLAAETGAWLVHYSTDYVFDGSGSTPWNEADPTGPLNAYGQTKLEGEQAIAASGCQYLNFRTSWVYAANGNNFLKTMLRLAKDRETLNVVADQWGAPTGAELIADVTAQVLQRVLGEASGVAGITATPFVGTYHLAAAGAVNWHGYASHVIERARQQRFEAVRVRQILPVATSAFPTPALRPGNSRLNTQRLKQTFGLQLPAWQSGVDAVVDHALNDIFGPLA